MPKKILITGGTGLIGKILCSRLLGRGDEVAVFTRSASKAELLPQVKIFEWDYHNPGQWEKYLQGYEGVIHLAGVNLFSRRWSREFKAKIIESRKVSTYNLAAAINRMKHKPEVFISASGIGYYGETGEKEADESFPPGNDFLAAVCKEWENSASVVESSGVRRVSIRTGVGLSTREGALKQMLLPFRLFAGGPLGSGQQWFSWIHLSDVADGYIFALDNDALSGAVNVTSPNPVRMKEFADTLGTVLKRPSFFRVPASVLKIAVGEAAEVITYSQKAVPGKLIKSGFNFKFPLLKDALVDLLKKPPR